MRKKKNPWETDGYLSNMIMDMDAAMSNQVFLLPLFFGLFLLGSSDICICNRLSHYWSILFTFVCYVSSLVLQS